MLCTMRPPASVSTASLPISRLITVWLPPGLSGPVRRSTELPKSRVTTSWTAVGAAGAPTAQPPSTSAVSMLASRAVSFLDLATGSDPAEQWAEDEPGDQVDAREQADHLHRARPPRHVIYGEGDHVEGQVAEHHDHREAGDVPPPV